MTKWMYLPKHSAEVPYFRIIIQSAPFVFCLFFLGLFAQQLLLRGCKAGFRRSCRAGRGNRFSGDARQLCM
jgi:hypothetical protein